MSLVMAWQHGGTWLLDVTIISDATAGTHTKTITIQPQKGSDALIIGGRFLNGAATQTFNLYVDSGATANLYFRLIPAAGLSLTTGQELSWPNAVAAPAAANVLTHNLNVPLSGDMRLVSTISSATVSLTDRWWFVIRCRGREPTVTAADAVGTPTITTNESIMM